MSCSSQFCGAQPVLFVPHGGGPCFQMPDPQGTWTNLRNYLEKIPSHIRARPKGVVMISGHWEENVIAVNAKKDPGLLYDYSGFPDYTYDLKWPVKGDPELANRVYELLGENKIPAKLEFQRGLDHGVFVPMMVSDPHAHFPVVQVSLKRGLDLSEHFNLGEALQQLRRENVLIVASGFTYHNLDGMFGGEPDVEHQSSTFDAWLVDAVMQKDHTVRKQKLTQELPNAPFLRKCHPREEHLIPLVVAAGAAGDDLARHDFNEKLMGKIHHSAFWFGDKMGADDNWRV